MIKQNAPRAVLALMLVVDVDTGQLWLAFKNYLQTEMIMVSGMCVYVYVCVCVLRGGGAGNICLSVISTLI